MGAPLEQHGFDSPIFADQGFQHSAGEGMGPAVHGAGDPPVSHGSSQPSSPQQSGPMYQNTDILRPGQTDPNEAMTHADGGRPGILTPGHGYVSPSHVKDEHWENTVQAQMKYQRNPRTGAKELAPGSNTRAEAEAEADRQHGTVGGYYNRAYDGLGGMVDMNQDFNDQSSAQRQQTAEELMQSRPKTSH